MDDNTLKTSEEIAIERIEEARKTGAISLDLSGLGLTALPIEIRGLTNLKSLNIGNEILKAVLEENWPWEEDDDRSSDFFDYPIEDIQVDSVNSNVFNSFPVEILELPNLERLGIEGVNLVSLHPEIQKLTRLKFLNLSANKLTSLPSQIGLLVNLEELILTHNKITFLPSEIQELRKLKLLDLQLNPFPVPDEILIERTSPKKILSYYFAIASSGNIPLGEVKLLVVGQGAIGKTSIIKRIIYDEFYLRETKTDGISINQWKIKGIWKPKVDNQDIYTKTVDVNSFKIRINIWDFGGQEIMHATHQFFLTKRSLYLLVLDSRLTQEENRVEYWLKIIQSFGGESPVLIVGNKIDQHPLDIDRTGLQKKYPNIVGILETSAATGAGIEELKAAIAEQVNNLPHVRDLLPETWFTVKTKLEELGKQSNFITHDKYLELCAENKVSDETSQRTLIGFLHDLGVVLHYQDDPRLEALGILNPQWVTNGVYKILNSHALFQNKGVLTTSMLDEILNLPEYPRGKRLFIVDMMKKFELCYDIESDKTFLVPDLLPKDEPAELKFNGVPAFEYAYPVLPSSVITRFIVRMNQKIDDGFVWRTGVVLKIGDNKALVKADIEDRKITISIDGLEHTRRNALLAVCTHLDEIHESIKGLNPEKLIPVPGAVNAKPLSYNYLLMLEAKGIEVLPVPDGNNLIDVNIRKVLSGVPNEIRPKEGASNVTTIYNVNTGGGDFTGRDKSISAGDHSIVVGGKVSDSRISASYSKVNSAEINSELKETMKQLAEAVDVMIQKLPTEQAAEVAEDFGKLVEEAVKPKPNQKWYSVSIEGLIKAAENLDKVGTPVISLSRKVLSLLTGGVVK